MKKKLVRFVSGIYVHHILDIYSKDLQLTQIHSKVKNSEMVVHEKFVRNSSKGDTESNSKRAYSLENGEKRSYT